MIYILSVILGLIILFIIYQIGFIKPWRMLGINNSLPLLYYKNFYGAYANIRKMQVLFIKIHSTEEKIRFMNTALEYSLSKNSPYFGSMASFIVPEITVVIRDEAGVRSSFTSSNMLLQYLREGETIYAFSTNTQITGILVKSNLKWRQFIATRFVGIVTSRLVDSAVKIFESPDTIWHQLQSEQNSSSEEKTI